MATTTEPKKPVYAPPEQSLLPGYKRYVSAPPIDWRKWNDGRGTKVDAPKFRGPEFTGRIVPPLLTLDSKPVQLGTLQVMRQVTGAYVVVDWSKPIDAKSAEIYPSPVMGRIVFKTTLTSKRAIQAMSVLHRIAKDKAAGLPADPAPCVDMKKKLIAIGSLSVCRYARGKAKGTWVIVDATRSVTHGKRELFWTSKSLKLAVNMLIKLARERGESNVKAGESAPPPKPKKLRMRGAPIAFDVPDGLTMGPAPSYSWRERDPIPPSSTPWKTIVELYARTGKWCRTAMMIWPMGNFPDALIAQALEARSAHALSESPLSSV